MGLDLGCWGSGRSGSFGHWIFGPTALDWAVGWGGIVGFRASLFLFSLLAFVRRLLGVHAIVWISSWFEECAELENFSSSEV